MGTIAKILNALALNSLINNINKRMSLTSNKQEIEKLKKRKAELKKQFSGSIKKKLNKKLSSGLTLRQVLDRDMLDKKDLNKNLK